MKARHRENTYELVYCFFKKPIMKFHMGGWIESHKARGILVRTTGNLSCEKYWYHDPQDYLIWKYSDEN